MPQVVLQCADRAVSLGQGQRLRHGVEIGTRTWRLTQATIGSSVFERQVEIEPFAVAGETARLRRAPPTPLNSVSRKIRNAPLSVAAPRNRPLEEPGPCGSLGHPPRQLAALRSPSALPALLVGFRLTGGRVPAEWTPRPPVRRKRTKSAGASFASRTRSAASKRAMAERCRKGRALPTDLPAEQLR